MPSGETSAASIAIGDERVALADAARRFLSERCPPSVVRHTVDHADRGAPPFTKILAELGWLALHVPETVGGQGFGVGDAVIIAEELGRVVAPGPLGSTMCAATLLRASLAVEPNDAVVGQLCRLIHGEDRAVVVIGAAPYASVVEEGSLTLSANFAAVAGADEADFIIVPVRTPGPDEGVEGNVTEHWYVLDADQVTTRTIEPLDVTRSIAEVRAHAVILDHDAQLKGVDRAVVEAAVATFTTAECAGIASWCTATAAAYARDRRQFGRPIGQFQAVKHRCADMLVATEASRGVAWDAAGAADDYFAALDGGSSTTALASRRAEWLLAAASAASVALDAAVTVAQDCIQVLGGIGFTWEHDAHLYLRRAVALRAQLGGTAYWRHRVAELALDGVRRRLRVDVPADAESQRDEIRAHAEELSKLEGTDQRARMVELGYLVPHWPEPWGLGADATTQLVIDAELRRAKVHRPHLQVGAWAAPTIATHGTPDQQERWVRPTLLGTTSWCQLFSEPEAGSDLAGLRTAAIPVDGGWSVTGQKVWTTMAATAEWGICLVRTDPDAPKHAGITYLIVDMKSPGIDVRPLREMTGLEMFNEVFFTDVFVPDDCVIGEVHGGWALARTTLGNERVSMGSGSSFGGGVENLLGLIAKPRDSAENRTMVDPVVLDRLGGLVAEAHAVATLGARVTLRSVSGTRPGPEASVRKLLGVEHDQRVQEFGLDLLGPAGAAIEGDGATWTFGFLANRCLTIAGGTSEIQRNVIGERLLGLPRDPESESR